MPPNQRTVVYHRTLTLIEFVTSFKTSAFLLHGLSRFSPFEEEILRDEPKDALWLYIDYHKFNRT